MNAIVNETLSKTSHKAVPRVHHSLYSDLFTKHNCLLVDSDHVEDGETFFKNSDKTLVVAIRSMKISPDGLSADQIKFKSDMNEDMALSLMEIFVKFRPDEFEIDFVNNIPGYPWIVRCYWF